MVDTYVSGAYGEICVGSSPISDNKKERSKPLFFILYATKILSSGKYAQSTYFHYQKK